MTTISKALFILLRLGIDTINASDSRCHDFLSLAMKDWRDVEDLSVKQRVAAIAFDGVQKIYDEYQNKIEAVNIAHSEWQMLIFEWMAVSGEYEQRSKIQKRTIAQLAKLWGNEGIKMMVFKGQANAMIYPNPDHRATGDIDCYLFENASRGERVLRDKGIRVIPDSYRHSKISFKDELVENHRVFSQTRGETKNRARENELVSLLDASKMKTIEGCGGALMPPAQFTAYFLSYHAQFHFISEGLRMKQILDWAVFLKVEQNNVDWNEFNRFCKIYGLKRFAEVMNCISRDYLGVELLSKSILANDKFAEKMMYSTLYDDDYLFDRVNSDWRKRWLLTRRMFTRDKWKYTEICEKNVWKQFFQNIGSFVFRKTED